VNNADFPGLTDIHAHPALNAWLWGRNLEHHWWSSTVFNPLATLSDFKMLRKGGVKVLWSSLHVPEPAYMECWPLRFVARFFSGGRMLLKEDAWTCLDSQRQRMERQVSGTDDMRIVRSNAELDAARAAGDVAIVHTVEGGHHLGAGLADDDLDGRLARVDKLAEWGVASLTLAHLFPNELAGHAEAIPEDHRKGPLSWFCKWDTGVDPKKGLTDVGRAVLDRMIERRIIPDISHCNPKSRTEIYEHVANRIPIVATHVGVQALNSADYNLLQSDVKAIKDSGGVIGVIFMPHWLDEAHPGPGLEPIWKTMELLHAWSGDSWDHVAIGTDFDGFTDPPDDVKDASRLPKVHAMLALHDVSDDDARKILGANARRVLSNGWV
jgi:microsomal dipeptidase-like Zn-dependent dipeptidase